MCGLKENPLWVLYEVGDVKVVNWLLYVYLLPMVMLGGVMWLAREMTFSWLKSYRLVVGLLSLTIVFAWLSLTVRQGFVGSVIDLEVHSVSQYEWYAYSAAWIVFGVGLLASGIVIKSQMLRYASLGVMMVSTCKIFLFDMKHLEGFLEAGSFLGLGLVLMGLGLVYQKIVFAKPKGERNLPKNTDDMEEDGDVLC
ncbi:hypothetical protein KS4_14360 [Poriferisphaera corsica]|uniref:DUF2339 domain-containing protein n=1 Tax=Poriferisphaera corsica TaxID=2528020 RepID=A0A517YT34_9BACT|nr:DUF2339 domain-containing protein [Poriferisphaera corsica]QDU33390.1 hypothetical protein KS4_14360 [Poriferisphaera corsica]